jgi:hypothetical protein
VDSSVKPESKKEKEKKMKRDKENSCASKTKFDHYRQ